MVISSLTICNSVIWRLTKSSSSYLSILFSSNRAMSWLFLDRINSLSLETSLYSANTNWQIWTILSILLSLFFSFCTDISWDLETCSPLASLLWFPIYVDGASLPDASCGGMLYGRIYESRCSSISPISIPTFSIWIINWSNSFFNSYWSRSSACMSGWRV